MILGFLLDENLKSWWIEAIQNRYPYLSLVKVGETSGPPTGTSDPDLLAWCESRQYSILTDNRSSMPDHLAEFVAAGGRIPGIFLVDQTESVVRVSDTLNLLTGASRPWEFCNQIRYLSEFY